MILLIQYLFLLDRLQDLDDAALTIASVHTFKDLAVFSTADLPDYLIVILVSGKAK